MKRAGSLCSRPSALSRARKQPGFGSSPLRTNYVAPAVYVQETRELHINLHGGRSSVSGVVATVFGCTGFLGRYVVNRLGKIGSQVVIPYRGEESAFCHLKVMGDLGQIVPVWFNIRDKDTVRRAMEHSNVVINLIGKHWETRNFSFENVHVDAARMIAEVAKERGIERFIHVSAANADVNHPSAFARTKAMGEQVVREIFPEATILRPCTVFGQQDWFLNKYIVMARYWPFYIHPCPDRKIQPIWASDFATALMNALATDEAIGKTYEIGGPKVYTMRDVSSIIAKHTLLEFPIVDVPMPILKAYARVAEKMVRKPRWVLDELKYLEAKDIVVPEGAKYTIQSLGLDDAALMENVTLAWMRHYRKPSFMNFI